jgi:hypothetical protein
MSDVDGTGGTLGIDDLEARWDIRYHVLNVSLPRRNPFNAGSGAGGGGGLGAGDNHKGPLIMRENTLF